MIDVGGDHVSRAVVAFAVECGPQAEQLRPRPTHGILGIVVRGHLLGQAQFFLERILANPQLREPVVQDRQVGRFDVHRQGRDRGVDLVDLTFEAFGIAGPMIDRRRRAESLDGLVDTVAIGGDDPFEVAQHPIFQRLGSNGRGHLADRAAMPASARADVIVGDHVRPTGLASLASWIAPELVAAVATFDHARQQPPAVVMASAALGASALGNHHLRLVPILAADDRRYRVGHHHPFILRCSMHLGFTNLALPFLRPALVHFVELRLGPPVPNQVATVGRILQDRLDGGVAPHVKQRSRDALGVEPVGDGAEPDPFEAPGEDVFDHLHALRLTDDQAGLALPTGLRERLALGVGRLQLAVFVVHLAHAPGTEANAEHHRPIGREDFPVVAIGCGATGIGLAQHGADLTAQRVLRQADRVLAVLELPYGPKHIAVDAIAVEVVLGDRQHLHVRLAKQVAIVLGLGHIASAEPVAVPDDDRFEQPGLGVGDHALEGRSFLGAGAADGVVHILIDHAVVVLLCVARHLKPLVADALVLLVGRAAQVGHGGDG